jgi:hypothetical protein
MQARLALALGSAVVLLSLVHCAGTKKPAKEAELLPPPDDGRLGAGGAGGAPEAEPERPRPDPALVQKALDRTGTPTAEDTAAHGLRFEVVEVGPSKTWALAVVNRGTDGMIVAFDPRLLTLELTPPPDPKAKKTQKPPKPRICRLPEELRPTRADAAYTVVLAPGHGLVEAFDPRLYCLPQGGVSAFVPGVRVAASLGWPVETKAVWRHGKREEEVLPQKAPFVAMLAPPPPPAEQDVDAGAVAGDAGPNTADATSDAGANPAAAPSTPDASGIVMTDNPTAEGEQYRIKELHGTPFELGADYAPPAKPPAAGLTFDVTQGSDAETERNATVTVELANRGTTAVEVYFRRELVTLEVSSVDGTTMCDPGPDDRSPDRQAFTRLGAGQSIKVTSRLAELCPTDTFARPGLYLVHGAFDGQNSGSEFGFDAFVGHLGGENAATVRIRKGTLPFPGVRALEDVQVGATH